MKFLWYHQDSLQWAIQALWIVMPLLMNHCHLPMALDLHLLHSRPHPTALQALRLTYLSAWHPSPSIYVPSHSFVIYILSTHSNYCDAAIPHICGTNISIMRFQSHSSGTIQRGGPPKVHQVDTSSHSFLHSSDPASWSSLAS